MSTAATTLDEPLVSSATTLVAKLCDLARAALERMYLPAEGLFAFHVKRQGSQHVLEGVSRRYTAIALIALADEPPDVARSILAGRTPEDTCSLLLHAAERTDDLGEVALTLWAARLFQHPQARRAVQRLETLQPLHTPHPTVDLCWAVSALSIAREQRADHALGDAIARRLITAFNPQSRMFPHWPTAPRGKGYRRHVSCFADLIYPIQALSHYHARTGDPEALRIAGDAARHLCDLQGPAGQWWWHYDSRTGALVEPYPVYAVHQDGMAPMALRALQEQGGGDFSRPILKGLEWLLAPPESPAPLIDLDAGVIWRKVARHEPRKLVRFVQSTASWIHPDFRVPLVAELCPPGDVDYESRPYHMGWLLHAWRGDWQADLQLAI